MYPILEFDATREALIEPSKVIQRRDVPEHCVLCFFREVFDTLIAEHDAQVIVANRWEDGPHPIYEITHRGQRLACYHPGIGSALSAALFEEAIAFGCRKFIACGGAGVLNRQIAVGHLVVVSSAIRDEGTSYHYLPPAREVPAPVAGLQALTTMLAQHHVPYQVGKTWTTDAPYRETPVKIQRRRDDDGCLTVEMECAALLAVAAFRKVAFGQVLYGGDDLSGAEWDNRGWQSRHDIRSQLFWLCADACLTL
jgi:uridine phosphorylase